MLNLATTRPTPPPGLPSGPDKAVSLRLNASTILLIEDEVFIATELRGALEAAGAGVRYARRLDKALTLIDGERFDGAILDVTLGTRTTCEPAARRLLARGVPFILHTGHLARHSEVINALYVPLVPKPAATRDVVWALATAMAQARS